ncbi:DNA gyrase inhibitor YacG [Xinfangfangia pollutisoli]|uniref:DNA gyrase inhibitor YacG n=1 Tax=Xinfangfangia pollutisoli TaxID=2865960 RepID=UPI001CD74E5F|nr:DNA gyrase inhibitor YacG [Xinfangfangia pollutisoli]
MTCPICGKEPEQRYRPFCSRRCADVDLARWLGGGYAIPGDAEDPDAPADAFAAPPVTNPRQ